MSSDDPIASITAGAVEGTLKVSGESIKSWIKKFKDKKLAFIRDEDTIKVVKEQLSSGELNFYQSYVENRETLFIVQLGLTLRRVEGDSIRRQNLRDKIVTKE